MKRFQITMTRKIRRFPLVYRYSRRVILKKKETKDE